MPLMHTIKYINTILFCHYCNFMEINLFAATSIIETLKSGRFVVSKRLETNTHTDNSRTIQGCD